MLSGGASTMPAMVMVRFSNEMRPTKAPPVSRAPSAAHRHGSLARLGAESECSSHHHQLRRAQWSGQDWRGFMPCRGLRHPRSRCKASPPSEARQRASVPVADRPVTKNAKQRHQTLASSVNGSCRPQKCASAPTYPQQSMPAVPAQTDSARTRMP